MYECYHNTVSKTNKIYSEDIFTKTFVFYFSSFTSCQKNKLQFKPFFDEKQF